MFQIINNNLKKLPLFFENQFRETDSLIRLLKLNKEQQLNFFRDFLSKKREMDIKKIQQQEIANKSKLFFVKKKKSSFYFYNPTEILKGKQISVNFINLKYFNKHIIEGETTPECAVFATY